MKNTIKVDAWTAGALLLCHCIMIYNMKDNVGNIPFHLMLIAFALAGFGFLLRIVAYKIWEAGNEEEED